MKQRAALIGFVIGLTLFGVAAAAQETVTLTTPESLSDLTGFRIERITIEADDPATGADEHHLTIQLAGVGRASALTCAYTATTTPTATALIAGLNKANLSSAYAGNATTGSLKQRIYHRLVVMNEAATVCGRSLVGTLTGSVP